ncbi:MAG: methyltransferase domain-containing protein [Acidobacteriota bacterium]
MKEVDFFVCPVCKNSLQKEERKFVCLKCKKEYKILNSVYDFSNLELSEETKKTVEQFGKSWEIFSHIEDYHKKQFLEWIYPLQEEDFKDKVVLEAGCGKGRHSIIVSCFKPKHLFSVDLSEAIFIAEKNYSFFLDDKEERPDFDFVKSSPEGTSGFGAKDSSRANSQGSNQNDKRKAISFVRADLKKLPFPDESFDLVFCVGVLHHIDKMEEALNEIWRVLKTKGKLCLWVYGREGNLWIIYLLNPIRKLITSKIPTKILRIFSFPLTLSLFLLLKTIYGPITNWGKKESFLYYSSYLGSISPFPFKEIESIVVDHLCPPVAYYLSRKEIEEMTNPLSPSEVTFRWHHKNSWTIILNKK